MRSGHIQIETKVAISYALFGGLWIIFSDSLLDVLITDHALYIKIQTYKGWFFVAASAVLIYFLIKNEVDKRKETDKKLRASEEALHRFELLSEHSRDIILFIRREDGSILDANAAAAKAYGYSREELQALTVQDLRAGDTRELTADQMDQADSRGILFETIHKRKDGSTFPVEVSSQGANIGSARTLVSIVRDITKRERAEQVISSLSKFPMENPNPILRVQNDGKLTYANAASQELLDMWGCQVNSYVPINLMELIGGSIESGNTQTVDVNCNEKIFSIMLVPIGENAYVNLYGRDMTERKRAEEELHQTLDELKRSNAELEQFAYVASHDLQEPLRGIAGMAQLLQKRYKGQLDNRADEFIDHMVDSTERMQKLINDLLTYSRIGRRGETIRLMEANTALKEAIKNLDVAIQEYGATITYENLPKVRIDATQFIRLFQNLIGNAIKFRSECPPQIHVGVSDAGEFWKFSVQDNGIGIEPQYFDRIFQVFQRLHTRREYKGTGIGLAICKKIIERHGGRIWVEAQFGQGSTFYFTLPKGY